MGLPIHGFRLSTWTSSGAISVRRGSKAEGFGVRLLRLRTVLVQQLLDTGNQLLVGKWLHEVHQNKIRQMSSGNINSLLAVRLETCPSG